MFKSLDSNIIAVAGSRKNRESGAFHTDCGIAAMQMRRLKSWSGEFEGGRELWIFERE
ncbi:MAG: hypothetical protein K2H52_00595 [Lachnospiraceae bacterium]|nr:hypothetical protein [Lachnospiraceae bacterium]